MKKTLYPKYAISAISLIINLGAFIFFIDKFWNADDSPTSNYIAAFFLISVCCTIITSNVAKMCKSLKISDLLSILAFIILIQIIMITFSLQ